MTCLANSFNIKCGWKYNTRYGHWIILCYLKVADLSHVLLNHVTPHPPPQMSHGLPLSDTSIALVKLAVSAVLAHRPHAVSQLCVCQLLSIDLFHLATPCLPASSFDSFHCTTHCLPAYSFDLLHHPTPCLPASGFNLFHLKTPCLSASRHWPISPSNSVSTRF